MIIDSHVHIGKSLFSYELSPEKLVENMDRLEIDKAVIIPFKPPDYHFEPENEFMAEIMEKFKRRFIGLGRIDPWRKHRAEAEAHRIFGKLNLAGLFIHPWEENCPLTAAILRPIIEIAREYKKPVMLSGGHVRVSHPRQVEFIAQEFPDVTFIATSGGQINICGELLFDAEEMLTSCPNVIMETSGIYRRDFIEQMTKKIGASRVIFGSGTPYYDQDFELERIKTAKISAGEKEMILGKAAMEIFKM